MTKPSEGEWFQRELVCIHILDLKGRLPDPLLKKTAPSPSRRNDGNFNVGLPELAMFTAQGSLVRTFPYFWPFTRGELDLLKSRIEIMHQVDRVRDVSDIESFLTSIEKYEREPRAEEATTGILLTLNDFTRHFTSRIVSEARRSNFQELVIIKDPSRPPYLCSFPCAQRGFKRPWWK